VTHDPGVAGVLARRVLVRDGRLVAPGQPVAGPPAGTR
jgi:hypothetical protein